MFSSGVNLGGGGNAGGTGWKVTGTSIVTNPVIQGNVFFTNPTPAILAVQQNSFDFVQTGQGFATTPAASQPVAFRTRVEPVQGVLNPTGSLVFASSINGAAYSTLGNIDSTGRVIFTDFISNGGLGYGLNGVGGTTQGISAIGSTTRMTAGALSGRILLGDNFGNNYADFSPDTSTLLDLPSLTRALRLPRLTNRGSIPTPVNGHIAYDAATNDAVFFAANNFKILQNVVRSTTTISPAGPFNNDFQFVGQTNPNSPSGDLSNNTSIYVEASITIYNTGTNATCSKKVGATFKRVAGTYTQEGATQVLTPAHGDATLSALTITLNLSASVLPSANVAGTYTGTIRIVTQVLVLINQ
jgi:hypothetical protein